MNYALLGWLNVILVAILLSPFILTRLNRSFIKTKNPTFQSTVKFLRKLHKPLGAALLLVTLIHGWMALGGLRLHTGTLLFLSFLVAGLLGFAFHATKKPALFKWHRRILWLSTALSALHLLFPGAIYYLFNS